MPGILLTGRVAGASLEIRLSGAGLQGLAEIVKQIKMA